MAFAFNGSGTEADPYLVKTADDLYSVRNYPSAYFKLANDIDLTQWIADNYPDTGWAPICSSTSSFTGTFDGNGFAILGLYINRTTNYNGLFGQASGATLRNIHVKCNITGSGSYSSAIVGKATSTNIYDCIVEGNVSGGQYTGGIVGSGSALNIQRCAVEGNVTASGSEVGGLIGYYGNNSSTGGYIKECYVKGNVSASNFSYVGGLIGREESRYYYSSSNLNHLSVYECYYDGNVSSGSTTSAGSYVGGIAGSTHGFYCRCYAKGTVTGYNYVGGIIGAANGNSNIASGCISCVCLCTNIKTTYSNTNTGGRIYGDLGSHYYTSSLGSTSENKAISECTFFKGSTSYSFEDGDKNGYATSSAALKRQATYELIGWNFTDTWGIEEGIGYPYLRWHQPDGTITNTAKNEQAAFNFTLPAELTPAVTPSDEEDSGVNITTNTFTNNDITVSFGLGTRTQSFAARLWTNDDLSTGLRVYKDGTMTIATSSDNLITRIALTGDDTSNLTANVGTISGGVWTGEASSVTFTIGASYNKINTIDVTYKHDILALTDVAPAIMKGTYEPGKVKYSRVSGGDYASFCLPFDIDLSEATGIETVYMPMEQIIYNTETEWLMMFLDEQDMTSTVKAGTPFLAKTSDSEVTFSNSKRVSFSQPLSENPVAKTLKVFNFDGHSGVLYKNNTLGVTWGGTYVPTEATEGMNSFNINGSFGQHTGTLNAYRAYVMQTSTAASRVRGIQLNLAGDEGEVTSVFQLLNEPATTEGIYDMTGRRVLNTQQGGLYIINGKKVVK